MAIGLSSGGKVGGQFAGKPLALLHTVGAKSGKPRINPVACLRDGDRYVIIASKGGAPTNPDWYYNVIANPLVTVEYGTETFKAHAAEWSANDVLAHLRACADVWGNCIVTIITQDKPTLRAVNPRTWIKDTDYGEQEFQSSLGAFATQRTKLLRVLEPLTREGWSRTALVTGAGKPLERTVLFYGQWLVRHERPHLKQIARIMNTMHV